MMGALLIIIGMALGFAYFVADNFALAMGDLGAKARFKRAQTGADAEPSGSSAPQVRRGPREARGARFGNPSLVRGAD